MLKQKYQFKNYNWVLIGAVLILSGMGVLFINSADSSYTSKQLVGLIFCTGVMLFLSVVNFNSCKNPSGNGIYYQPFL